MVHFGATGWRTCCFFGPFWGVGPTNGPFWRNRGAWEPRFCARATLAHTPSRPSSILGRLWRTHPSRPSPILGRFWRTCLFFLPLCRHVPADHPRVNNVTQLQKRAKQPHSISTSRQKAPSLLKRGLRPSARFFPPRCFALRSLCEFFREF